MTTITRIGKTTGRWPNYRLLIDGIDAGSVRRTVSSGHDRMSPTERHDGWLAAGRIFTSREDAEAAIMARAERVSRWQTAFGSDD